MERTDESHSRILYNRLHIDNYTVITKLWQRLRSERRDLIHGKPLTASSFIVRNGKTKSEIAGKIIYSNTTATFSPTEPLTTDTTYTVTLTTDIQDLSGNPLQADFTWSFTTMETVPPRVVSTYPLNSARGVQVFPTIAATFNEPRSAGTINSTTFLVYDGNDYMPAQ